MTLSKVTFKFKDIHIGMSFGFEHVFTKKDENLFGKLTGDLSKMEMVHGMLAGSLFSTLIDMYCPGPESILLSQTLEFRKPLYYGKIFFVRGTITDKGESARIVTIKSEIVFENEVVVKGESKVMLRK